MKPRTLVALIFLAFTAVASAKPSTFPAQILCTPEEHHRTGIENPGLPRSTAHLFEYGGRVMISKSGDNEHFSYGEGQDFYISRERTPYSKDFINIRHEILIANSYPGLADSKGFLILNGHFGTEFFHIDWEKKSYYGYTHKFGEIHSYSGSCAVLKNEADKP